MRLKHYIPNRQEILPKKNSKVRPVQSVSYTDFLFQ